MESLRTRSHIATGAFGVMLVASAATVLSDLSLLESLRALSLGEPVDLARAEEIDSHQGVMGLLYAGSALACALDRVAA